MATALQAACVSRKKALITGVAYAALFQLQIEIFDGMYKKYGFSYADMLANTTGQMLEAEQELHPHLKWLKPTISYSQSDAMRNRANFTGPSELRRSLDYSGQTYWFSANIHELLGQNRIWKTVKHELSYYHFPAPAVQLMPAVRGISWYR
jgi:hypothetical protein